MKQQRRFSPRQLCWKLSSPWRWREEQRKERLEFLRLERNRADERWCEEEDDGTAAEWGVGKSYRSSFHFYTREIEDPTVISRRKKPPGHVSVIQKRAALHLLNRVRGISGKGRSCASVFATFGHIKRQMARGPVRLTVGPPRHVPSGRSAKHREINSFYYHATFD